MRGGRGKDLLVVLGGIYTSVDGAAAGSHHQGLRSSRPVHVFHAGGVCRDQTETSLSARVGGCQGGGGARCLVPRCLVPAARGAAPSTTHRHCQRRPYQPAMSNGHIVAICDAARARPVTACNGTGLVHLLDCVLY